MGPYATGAILAAMGVAQRYQKVLVHHSFGMPHLAKYEMHFPTAAFGPEPNMTAADHRLQRRWPTAANPPKTVAILTSKFPSAQFLSAGAKDVAEKRGLKVVLYLEYEFGTRDWARDGGPGQGRQARSPLGRRARPRRQPAPRGDEEARLHAAAALPPVSRRRARSRCRPTASWRCASRVFEEHPPFMSNPGTARLVSRSSEKRREGQRARTRTSIRRWPARSPPGRCSRRR